MITLTRLDGMPVCVNEINILWVEALPDTSVMLLGGTRILVKESVPNVKDMINELVLGKTALQLDKVPSVNSGKANDAGKAKVSNSSRADSSEELGP
jgi:uncharacterized protein YlzI (FlbEa/FlbD family)